MTPVLASLLAATEGSRDERCTCQPGRASDGSEHGPCAWCEDAPFRDLISIHAEGDPPEPEDLEDYYVEI
jgi:hypothetical protein